MGSAPAGVDGRGGVIHMGDEGRASDIGAVQIARFDIEVFGESDHAHDSHGHAGGKEAVDIGEFEPGIFQRTPGALRHDE